MTQRWLKAASRGTLGQAASAATQQNGICSGSCLPMRRSILPGFEWRQLVGRAHPVTAAVLGCARVICMVIVGYRAHSNVRAINDSEFARVKTSELALSTQQQKPPGCKGPWMLARPI
jgi:hypothetical protein